MPTYFTSFHREKTRHQKMTLKLRYSFLRRRVKPTWKVPSNSWY
jgi:hypothetical protein